MLNHEIETSKNKSNIGGSDLGRVGFAMHYWLHLSNSSKLDCIRFERSFSPFETKSETLVKYRCS